MKHDLSKFKSISEIPDRQLLESIFATQLIILRKLEHMADQKVSSPQTATSDMIDKIPHWADRINDYLGRED